MNAFLGFVRDQRAAWKTPDASPDVFGFKMAARVVRVFANDPVTKEEVVDAAQSSGEELWLKLKWGMALVGRAIDLSWACDNSYSGETVSPQRTDLNE